MLVFELLSGAVEAYEIAHSPFHEISSLPHRFDDFMIYWHRLPFLHTKSFYSAPDGEIRIAVGVPHPGYLGLPLLLPF